ncbi:MAG: phosphoribosylanthranilate isomerase [Pirellulaceae bacterium]|nr:phosphoribosylanthranilate isomerase [Pirellulaceae bacterium]
MEELAPLAAAGVDTVGFNLVPISQRRVDVARAAKLVARAHELGLTTVAVVMDPGPAELTEALNAAPWDYVQLHGRESPDISAYCPRVAIIKAISWSGRTEEIELAAAWSKRFGKPNLAAGGAGESRSLGWPGSLAGFLVDAYAPGVGGGTGMQADWGTLNPRPAPLCDWPLLLAGGLTPKNVRQAIVLTGCDGVDTASGVELSPGAKSTELVTAFSKQARQGFASISSQRLS